MGKGDKKSKKGKLWRGTYGVNRPRKANTASATPVAKTVVAKQIKESKPKAKPAKQKADQA